jgi:hypothetical protein
MRNRFYPGLERASISRAVRAELLLTQVQEAIAHQRSWQRPWQRYEPLWAFLESEIWPNDQTVLLDLSFAKLAIEILSEEQRRDIEAASPNDAPPCAPQHLRGLACRDKCVLGRCLQKVELQPTEAGA